MLSDNDIICQWIINVIPLSLRRSWLELEWEKEKQILGTHPSKKCRDILTGLLLIGRVCLMSMPMCIMLHTSLSTKGCIYRVEKMSKYHHAVRKPCLFENNLTATCDDDDTCCPDVAGKVEDQYITSRRCRTAEFLLVSFLFSSISLHNGHVYRSTFHVYHPLSEKPRQSRKDKLFNI